MTKKGDSPTGDIEAALSPVERLLAVMAELRDPVTGCEWDSVQTFATIAPYTIEEAYEVADAIQRGDMADLKDELGDLLLQVVFHARMAEEEGAFDFHAVAATIADKMERRHPHLFGKAAQGGHHLWEQIKAEERGEKGHESALDGVALALPALLRAEKLQKRAARTGFDWPDPSGARAKIDEELAEIEAAGPEEVEEEIGDLLFAVVNWARKLGIDPEAALRAGNTKFERRFRAMENSAGAAFSALSLEDKELLWNCAKAGEPTPPSAARATLEMNGEFTMAALETAGFRGWLPFGQIRSAPDLPSTGGVYIVAYIGADPIVYPDQSVGGWFKGRDPAVEKSVLKANWVPGAEIVYVGKADQLRRRLIQFADFGVGKPIGHWGGRLIWQLPNPSALRVAWLETPGRDPLVAEQEMIARFRRVHGKPPFANSPQLLGR